MGPLVLTEDGQYRVIANWAEMTEQERELTKRRIEKRNRERQQQLLQKQQQPQPLQQQQQQPQQSQQQQQEEEQQRRRPPPPPKRSGDVEMSAAAPPAEGDAAYAFEYDYRGFTCAVRHKRAAPGFEGAAPILLIHPIGIGLDSWFWGKFIDAWVGAELFAPDLIGCGASSAWDPSAQGLFVPLDWSRQLETLWRERIGPERPMHVVCQGGVAPIAALLASRQCDLWDGPKAVRSVILTSPPPWDEISGGISDSASVERNFAFFSSPLGTLSYRLLRTTGFVRFFSDLFLFDANCDDEWLRRCVGGATLAARWPVFAFNSGLVGATGRDAELRSLAGPLLVLSGEGDRRAEGRAGYGHHVTNCELRTLPASLNVLPWEVPEACAEAISAFVSSGTTLITQGTPPK